MEETRPFLDRNAPPSDSQLHETLGRAGVLWDLLHAALAAGRGVRLEVRNKKDLTGVEKLAAVKMAS